MKRLSYYFLTALTALSAAFSGCSDEIDYPVNPVEQARDGIFLRIPDAKGLAQSMETRGETADLIEKEGSISTLYLLAFKSDKSKKLIIPLHTMEGEEIEADASHPTNTGYKEYDLTNKIKQELGNDITGSWNIYVAANIDPYIDGTLEGVADEDALKALRLNFVQGASGSKTYMLDPNVAFAGTNPNGLPMVAKGGDIIIKDKTGVTTGTGSTSLSTSTNCTIHADLEFLCSKVRYTLFFNNEDEAYSKGMFPGMSMDLETSGGVKVTSVPNKGTGLIAEDNANSEKVEALSFAHATRDFPSNASSYPEESDKSSNLTGSGEFNKKAFQGTMYLPENSSTTDASSMLFTGHVLKDENNAGATLKYTMPLLPQEDDGSTALKRGTFYDIAAKITGLETLEFTKFQVAGWTPKSLVFSLLPPTFLHVEKTQIAVTAGKTTTFWYDSNVEVTGKSPVYGGIPIYNVSANPSTKTITVTVNSGISTAAFGTITSDENINQYNYFYLEAGNIREKINISSLILRRFLTVSPQELTIDARDRITSGEYSGDREIKIETNVKKITLSTEDWFDALNAGNIEIWDGSTQLWNSTSSANSSHEINMEGKNGIATLTVKFKNINGGDEYWELGRTKNFTVTPENDGITSSSDEYVDPKDVKVKTEPNNDNFTIYFKPDQTWYRPHIYVYQCLELPGDTGEKTIWYDGSQVKRNLSSYPVGYQAGLVAALEYSFTGAVAFKGWDQGQNYTDYHDNIGKGYLNDSGFFMFDGSGDAKTDWCDWNPKHTDAGKRYYLGSQADFAKAWRTELRKKTGNEYCSGCVSGTGNQIWPGIRMIKEELTVNGKKETWYRFELSGVATPGKALIMFTDVLEGDHSECDSGRRYPNDKKNGVPLFDFPNRVGYYDMTKGYWTNTVDGTGSQEDVITNYAIKWPQQINNAGDYYLINVSYPDGSCPFSFTGTEDWKYTSEWNNKVFTMRFNAAPVAGKKLIIKIKDPNTGKVYKVNKDVTDESFTGWDEDADKTYRVLDLKATNFTEYNGDDPTPPDPPTPTGKYMIKWPNYLNQYNYNFYQVFVEYSDGTQCDRFNDFKSINGDNKAEGTANISDSKYFWVSGSGAENDQNKKFGYAFKDAPTGSIKITIKNAYTSYTATSTFTADDFTGEHKTSDGTTYKVLELTKSNFSPYDGVLIKGDYNIAYKTNNSKDYTKIYYWGGGSPSNFGSSPNMEIVDGSDGQTYKVYKVPSGTTNVIFSFGSDSDKTADLTYSNNKVMNNNGSSSVNVKFVPASVRRKPNSASSVRNKPGWSVLKSSATPGWSVLKSSKNKR